MKYLYILIELYFSNNVKNYRRRPTIYYFLISLFNYFKFYLFIIKFIPSYISFMETLSKIIVIY